MNQIKPKFAFFGTPRRGAEILQILKEGGMIPSFIITNPDMPKGRGMKMTPSEVKIWAMQNDVPFIQPQNLEKESLKNIKKEEWDFFLVVSYGKIMPRWLIDMPKYGSLNIHFSLLPKYRGATPVEAAILNEDTETGVSLVLMDEKLDHGPIVAREKYTIPEPLPTSFELVEDLTNIGGKLLLEKIPEYLAGKINPEEQDHQKATHCGKIKKEDGLIDLNGNPLKNWRKIKAYYEWPKPYFFAEKKGKNIRVIIREAKFENGQLEILKVIPEGRKEISYAEFQRQK